MLRAWLRDFELLILDDILIFGQKVVSEELWCNIAQKMVEKWSKQWIKGIAQMLERFLEKSLMDEGLKVFDFR